MFPDCCLEAGRRQPADEEGRGALQTGMACAEASRGSPGCLELRVGGKWPEIQQELQGPDDAGPLLWLRHLICTLKALGGPCRILSTGTAHLSGECHWLQSRERVGKKPVNVGPARRLLPQSRWWHGPAQCQRASRTECQGKGCVRMEPPGAGLGQGAGWGRG